MSKFIGLFLIFILFGVVYIYYMNFYIIEDFMKMKDSFFNGFDLGGIIIYFLGGSGFFEIFFGNYSEFFFGEKGWVDLDNDGRKDVYIGDDYVEVLIINGLVFFVDWNKDGKIDVIYFDMIGDGSYDIVYFDEDYNGKIDMWRMIFNGVDSYVWDIIGDGIFDVYDFNGDGKVDVWDINFDGIIDECDVDYDGIFDLYDYDFDGVFDEFERNVIFYFLESVNGILGVFFCLDNKDDVYWFFVQVYNNVIFF